MGWFAARSEARRTFRWFWTPDKSLLGLVRSEHWIRSGLLAAPIPSDVMSLAPVGDIAQAGMQCLRVLPMSPLLQEQNYRSQHPCLKGPFEKSTKNRHRRWGEGSYGKICFKAVSERGRCWQLIRVRAEGSKRVWE